MSERIRKGSKTPTWNQTLTERTEDEQERRQSAGLGYALIQEYQKLSSRLSLLENRFQEMVEMVYSVRGSGIGQPRVTHSLVCDQIENRTLAMMSLRDEIEQMRQELDEMRRNMRRMLRLLSQEENEAVRLRHFSGLSASLSEQEWTDRKKLRPLKEVLTEAYRRMWHAFEWMGLTDILMEARKYLLIRRYYEKLVEEKHMTRLECEQEIQKRCRVSPRSANRKIRLLYLVPELQDWVRRGQICQTAGYHLSFLKESRQRTVVDLLMKTGRKIQLSPAQAADLRDAPFRDWYHLENIQKILDRNL